MRDKKIALDRKIKLGENKQLEEIKKLTINSELVGRICIKLICVSGVPGEIRTPDRTLRRRMLYPAELLGHDCK